MKSSSNYLSEKIFTFFIISAMVSIPLLEFIGLFLRKSFFYQEEILSLVGFVFSFLLFLYLLFLNMTNLYYNKKDTYNKTFVLSDFFLILSILFCVISITFSKDITKSLLGEYGYSETPLQVLAYFSLFFMCTLISTDKYKRIIFKTFVILAIFESAIAFLQNFSLWPIPCVFDEYSHQVGHMAFGLTEHCNFFAAISIIFTAICSSKFIYEENQKKSYIYLLFSTITCLGTLFTYTRIGWVGLFSIIFGIIFIEFFIHKYKKDKINLKKIFILSLCIIICFLIVGILSGQLIRDFSISAKELTSNFENFGTKRGTIWKIGLSSLKYYPFTGVGFDNYRYSFKIYPENFGWSQNKGHNEYIHTLVTQGIFSGINYLAFAFYCCFFPFKKILKADTEFAKSKLTRIFLIALFAYFVQALFNSSVTNVAPYKWILMGLLLPRTEQKNLFEIKLFKKNLEKKNEKTF